MEVIKFVMYLKILVLCRYRWVIIVICGKVFNVGVDGEEMVNLIIGDFGIFFFDFFKIL